jgi:hypothetical protein
MNEMGYNSGRKKFLPDEQETGAELVQRFNLKNWLIMSKEELIRH